MLLWYPVCFTALALDTLMDLYMKIDLSAIYIYCREVKFTTGNFVRSIIGIVQPRYHIRTRAGLLEGFELSYLSVRQSFVFCYCVICAVTYHKRNFVRKILAVNQFDFSHNYQFLVILDPIGNFTLLWDLFKSRDNMNQLDFFLSPLNEGRAEHLKYKSYQTIVQHYEPLRRYVPLIYLGTEIIAKTNLP